MSLFGRSAYFHIPQSYSLPDSDSDRVIGCEVAFDYDSDQFEVLRRILAKLMFRSKKCGGQAKLRPHSFFQHEWCGSTENDD